MMKYSKIFVAGISQKALDKGFALPLKIDFSKSPHLLLSAPSGAGKTYALKFILKQLKGIVYLCDFKGIDFVNMQNCERYFKHKAVAEGLETVYSILQERMANPTSENIPVYLVIDEWTGFISSCPKKEQTDFQSKLSSILMLGRGCNVFNILSLQRADSSNFLSGSRDNYGNILGLGRQSKEAVNMLFKDDSDLIKPKPRGKGYLKIDGQPINEIIIPKIRDMSATDTIIKGILSNKGVVYNA